LALTQLPETAAEQVPCFGAWSLRLFVAGLLGPIAIVLAIAVINAFAPRPIAGTMSAGLAICFGLISQILAFIFGVLGRRTTAGRIGLWGSGIVLGLAFVWWLVPMTGPAPPGVRR